MKVACSEQSVGVVMQQCNCRALTRSSIILTCDKQLVGDVDSSSWMLLNVFFLFDYSWSL
jgi:hypothetical protein